MRRCDLSKRFWEKVSIKSKDECWEWMASKHRQGYGQFFVDDRIEVSHRMAWMLYYEDTIPGGKCIMHTCDNTGCCNPHHLQLGVQKQNIRDMFRKKRNNTPHGESQWCSKFTNDDIKNIRTRKDNGESADSIAKDFGVSPSTIYRIISKKTWRHV